VKVTRGERLKDPRLRKFATGLRAVLIKEANKRLINLYLRRSEISGDEYGVNQERIKELQALIIKLHGGRPVVRLTSPQLIKIRTGFRKLLDNEWGRRKREFEVQDNDNHQKYFHDKVIDEATYIKQLREIQAKQKALRTLRKRSIAICASCGDTKKDHVFVPQTREYYCEDCLQLLQSKNYFEVMENWDNFYRAIYE
jgi:hypothetical protein